jgi:glutamate synthase domain-containing protein 2
MGSSMIPDFAMFGLIFMAVLFIFAIGSGVAAVIIMYLIDIAQTKNAIRRNYPVIGRFRALFEHIGVFFRQYFFAMDREEMPFNRELRRWCYNAAQGTGTMVAFGSTRDLRPVGTTLFVNSAYAKDPRARPARDVMTIGPDCKTPHKAQSFFNISAMSYGSISKPAVRALSRGSAAAPCWLNTGEGGLAPYHLEGGGDIVLQIGTAKYGVRDAEGAIDDQKLAEVAENPQVKMIEIKLSQGAKPGKGGILPGAKVTAEIARIRGIPEGESSISPDYHPEIKNAGDLLALVERIRDITGKPVGFKAVIGSANWLDEVFAEILARGETSAPDFITVDSADGGTGAAPLPLIDYMGLPLGESLPLVADKLEEYRLRERIRVIASGKMVTPGPVATALCMGADFVQSARGFMFALGCIQALQCHKNTCPTGVTTHNPKLQRGLDVTDKSERVKRYARQVRDEVAIIAKSCGVAEPHQLDRHHCRVVQEDGRSVPLDELFPPRAGSG